MKITLAKGGTLEREIDVNQIKIPDMWDVVMRTKDPDNKKMVMECWYLAHDMKRALLEIDGKGGFDNV